jgi:hypothetical protein
MVLRFFVPLGFPLGFLTSPGFGGIMFSGFGIISNLYQINRLVKSGWASTKLVDVLVNHRVPNTIGPPLCMQLVLCQLIPIRYQWGLFGWFLAMLS